VNKDIAAALAAPFDAKDLKTRPGRSGQTYTYADVRAIDTRLDEVFGTMGWSFSWELIDAATAVVRGRLIVTHEGVTKTIEEAGYPNAAGRDEEPLKSSVTDSRRRAAAALGIGRSLYSPERGTQTPYRAAAPVSVPQIAKPEASAVLSDDEQVMAKAAMLFVQGATDGSCSHGEAWQLKPGGVSKASGKPYQSFWAASHKAPDGSWCKEKPSIKWIAAQGTPAPKLVPEEDLESLPF
jgi:hypothetical protein